MISQPTNTNGEKSLITRKHLRERLGVSDRTLSRLISTREVPPPFKVGRQDRWKPQVIEAWIEQKSQSVDRRKQQV
jgi:predicted DNA-binding transcriptional regulator AlpA